MAEEFGAAAGDEKVFLDILKRSTDPDFGFLFITFGLKIRFFNSYRSEWKLRGSEVENEFDAQHKDEVGGGTYALEKAPRGR